MKYKVGQVFYLVGAETAKVIPFRIVEEVTRTTLEGQEKTYIAELPDANQTKVPVAKLKGNVFDCLESLKDHMFNNARQAINAMVSDAEKLADISYGISKKEIPEAASATSKLSDPADTDNFKVLDKNDAAEETSSVQSSNESDIVKVDIGNGIVANMSMKDLEKVSQI